MAVTLHYYRSSPPNFGDELNALVWPALIPELAKVDREAVLVGIGTILNEDVPTDREVFILGSGAGTARLPAALKSGNTRVLAVRGPLTAGLAGLPAELAITDPALLIRTLYPQLMRSPGKGKQGPVIFVPHFTTAHDAGWRRACALAGIELVNPTDECHIVLRRIASARLVIAEAMHAAIVADALRIPWIPVASTRHFSTFKWVDWTLSLHVPFEPTLLPAVSVRHRCQRIWLSLVADRFLVEGVRVGDMRTGAAASEASSRAIAHLLEDARRRIESPRNSAQTLIRLKASAFYNRLVEPAIAWLSDGPLRPFSARMERRAAALLKLLAAEEGYLSEDNVSAARLRALQDKVAWLRGHLSARMHSRSDAPGTSAAPLHAASAAPSRAQAIPARSSR